MYKLSQDQLNMVKMAAFVDELVKIAVANDTPEVLAGVYDALTGDHLLLLKQAGLLDRIRAGAGAVASKAKDVVQNAGASGVARRMEQAGHEHDVLKNMMAPSVMRSSPVGPAIHRGSGLPKPFAVSEEGAHLAMLPKMQEGPRVQFMRGGKMQGSGMPAPTPSAAQRAGMAESAAQRAALLPPDLTAAASPLPAAAARSAAPAASPGIMDRLRAAAGGMVQQPA